MAKFENIIQNGYMCRNCINKLYGAGLERKDCIYDEPYPRQCTSCKEMKYSVTGLKLSGRLKLMFK